MDSKQNSLSQNEERLQLLQDATSDGIWDWNVLTHEVYWSNNSFRMIGYEPGEFEVTFEKWRSLIHPEDLPNCLKLIENSIETGKPLRIQYRYRKKDGSFLWVKSSGYGVEQDEKGQLTRIIGCHIDLSEQQLAKKTIEQKNRELEVLNKELAEANEKAGIAIKAKDEFLSVISHEMRTPLNPIIGFSEFMLDDLDRNHELHETANSIHDASLKMLRLVDDVLHYVRIQKHDFVPSRDKFTIRNLVEACIKNVSRRRHLDGAINVEYESFGSGSSPEDTELLIDRKMLQLVIVNLLDNAVTYSENQPIRIRVGLPEKPDKPLRVEIIDQGIGISRDQQKNIFDALYQVDSSYSRPYEGLGLGLAICKKTIKILNGKIDVISEEGKGSTFWIEVPAKRLLGESTQEKQEVALER